MLIGCRGANLQGSRIAAEDQQKIKSKKLTERQRGPLLSLGQAVTVDCSDVLGTARIYNHEFDKPAGDCVTAQLYWKSGIIGSIRCAPAEPGIADPAGRVLER